MTADLSSYDPDYLRRIELKMKSRRFRFLGPDDDRLEGVVGTALYLDETGATSVDRDSI